MSRPGRRDGEGAGEPQRGGTPASTLWPRLRLAPMVAGDTEESHRAGSPAHHVLLARSYADQVRPPVEKRRFGSRRGVTVGSSSRLGLPA
jgi:hypothetical protein